MIASTTIAGAFAALRARAAATLPGPLLWPDEPNVLPDAPTPFVFFELHARRGRVIGIGGGPGANLYRVPAELVAYVLVPRGQGLATALDRAETVAAAFRSWRDGAVSCGDASVVTSRDVVPDALDGASAVYACVVVSVSLHFDQVG